MVCRDSLPNSAQISLVPLLSLEKPQKESCGSPASSRRAWVLLINSAGLIGKSEGHSVSSRKKKSPSRRWMWGCCLLDEATHHFCPNFGCEISGHLAGNPSRRVSGILLSKVPDCEYGAWWWSEPFNWRRIDWKSLWSVGYSNCLMASQSRRLMLASSAISHPLTWYYRKKWTHTFIKVCRGGLNPRLNHPDIFRFFFCFCFNFLNGLIYLFSDFKDISN